MALWITGSPAHLPDRALIWAERVFPVLSGSVTQSLCDLEQTFLLCLSQLGEILASWGQDTGFPPTAQCQA